MELEETSVTQRKRVRRKPGATGAAARAGALQAKCDRLKKQMVGKYRPHTFKTSLPWVCSA
ncbi:hypothetical protein NCCP691_02020 [Noviherbaspirillum aridicola]|uniref:Uncharacterized protein n=1 Tax=Noviherbaspirillum aridicola TaxID=2849687 RepID=A0ABQ4PZD4_9BURK|nr:hypothetical protein NCCP691_02020 [Noviherbaspirillum aridicola]